MRRSALIVPAIVAALSLLLPTHAAAGGQPLVLGYYVPYDATSWASLQSHAEQLDIVATQSVSIDACGGVSAQHDPTLEQFAHARGLQVVPSLFTVSAWLNHRLLTDDGARAAAIQNVVGYTLDEGYDGFDLDLEGIDADDRSAYSAFVADLANELHARGKLLTLAIPAKERDTTTGWAGAFDYAALGAQADLVTIMAYEYRGPFSGPGSVAPFDWVGRVAAFASRQIAPEKVLLGLAFYGYDWNTTSGGAASVGYPRAATLAEYFQVNPSFDAAQQSLTFGYTAVPGDTAPGRTATPAGLGHGVRSLVAGPCEVAAPRVPAPTPAPGPEANVPQTHEVWVEDAGSVAARVGLAERYGLRGVAAWRLGLEDAAVWGVFERWRADAAAGGA